MKKKISKAELTWRRLPLAVQRSLLIERMLQRRPIAVVIERRLGTAHHSRTTTYAMQT